MNSFQKYWLISTPSTRFHCSCAVKLMDADGITRIIFAKFPRHKLNTPVLLILSRKNENKALYENLDLLTWKFIFARSSGAITANRIIRIYSVLLLHILFYWHLAKPPAKAPAIKEVTILCLVFNYIIQNYIERRIYS